MTLISAIDGLATECINAENAWYKWNINEDKLPEGVSLPDGNLYEKNVALKKRLHNLWSISNPQKKAEIIKWYISDWGGVRTNHKETMEYYSNCSPDEMILRGEKGIASWSKALCIHCPDSYAIFDARVSASLNALQIIKNTNEPILYPCLPSRNKVIEKSGPLFKAFAKVNNWEKANKSDVYKQYLSLLHGVVSQHPILKGSGIYTLEMLLFALAEKLIIEAFPGTDFDSKT